MRLVDDDRVVLAQLAVRLDLGEQDAVRHQLDEGVAADLVGEADLPADRLAQRRPQLLGHPLGDRTGRDPAGLGVPDEAADAPSELQADLGDLRRLAGAGLARDDHDLVVADRGEDLVLLLADRELFRVRDLGHRGAPLGDAQLRLLDAVGDLGEHGRSGFGLTDPARAVESTPQPLLVAQHQLGQSLQQGGQGGGRLTGHTSPRISPHGSDWRTICGGNRGPVARRPRGSGGNRSVRGKPWLPGPPRRGTCGGMSVIIALACSYV